MSSRPETLPGPEPAPPRKNSPGPKGGLLLGNLPAFSRDILGFITRCVREYGDFVHLRLPGYEVFLVQAPGDIETVLLTQRANFVKHSFFWKHITATDGSAARLPKDVYLPFGGGPRICIGERFAMMEGVLVLAVLAKRWRLEMADRDPVPFPSITLRPESGPVMRVRSRERPS